MSCWVVPTVAAELWGVSLEIVLERARSGLIHSKSENGFMFIDVAPAGECCGPPRGLRGPHPPTFTIVTPEEVSALINPAPMVHDPQDWRFARQLASRSRRPPHAQV